MQLPDWFPSNSFSRRLVSEMNYILNTDYPKFVGQEEIVVNHILKKECNIDADCFLRIEGDLVIPATHFTSLLFIGLYVPEARVIEYEILDGYDCYTSKDGRLLKIKHEGQVAFNVKDRNRLFLGYGGPVFEEYKKKVDELAEGF